MLLYSFHMDCKSGVMMVDWLWRWCRMLVLIGARAGADTFDPFFRYESHVVLYCLKPLVPSGSTCKFHPISSSQVFSRAFKSLTGSPVTSDQDLFWKVLSSRNLLARSRAIVSIRWKKKGSLDGTERLSIAILSLRYTRPRRIVELGSLVEDRICNTNLRVSRESDRSWIGLTLKFWLVIYVIFLREKGRHTVAEPCIQQIRPFLPFRSLSAQKLHPLASLPLGERPALVFLLLASVADGGYGAMNCQQENTNIS